MARAFIGTSGWSYRHWRDTVYPRHVRQSDWLSFLMCHLDTVEVNSSFYRIPTPQMITRWNELVRPQFEFALKMWRGITHYSKLKNAARNVARFLDVVEVLEPRIRAPMLIQLPPNQSVDIQKLDDFLREWLEVADARLAAGNRIPARSWLVPETLAVLDRHRAALCLHDMAGKGAASQPNSQAPFVYIRRHGPGEARYSGSYTSGQLDRDANLIHGWTRSGRDVYVYFNNDPGGHAFHNAVAIEEHAIRLKSRSTHSPASSQSATIGLANSARRAALAVLFHRGLNRQTLVALHRQDQTFRQFG